MRHPSTYRAARRNLCLHPASEIVQKSVWNAAWHYVRMVKTKSAKRQPPKPEEKLKRI